MRNTNQTLRVLAAFVMAIALTVIVGCHSTTTSPNDGGSTIVRHGAGSYFIMERVTRDSTGAIVSTSTTKEMFVATGLTIYGKSDVIALLDSSMSGWSVDTSYIRYESNGDVSSYVRPGSLPINGGTSPWITIPFGSQQSVTWLRYDTVSQFSAAHERATFAGAGSGSVTIKGQTFSTENVVSSITLTDTTFGPTNNVFNSSSSSTIFFAPALGDIAAEDQPATRDPMSGQMGTSSHGQVVDYHLQ